MEKWKKKLFENIRIHVKRMRTTPNCEIKIVMAKEFDIEVKLQKIIIFLHINKKSPCFSQNHRFDYSDFIKLNSAV